MNSSVMEVPVEVQSTTNQINNMLTKINEQQSMIERLKEIRNKYADAAIEFDRHSMKIKELKDAIKEERKLIEMLVEYVKNNYGFDFAPGSLFNPEEITEESE